MCHDRIETLLNRVFWIKLFVYTGVSSHRIGRLYAIVVDIRVRRNSLPFCSGSGKAWPVYDHMPDHSRFESIPLWNLHPSIFTIRCAGWIVEGAGFGWNNFHGHKANYR